MTNKRSNIDFCVVGSYEDGIEIKKFLDALGMENKVGSISILNDRMEREAIGIRINDVTDKMSLLVMAECKKIVKKDLAD